MTNVSSKELLSFYNDNILIIDVRSKEDYSKKHIPNSYNIPYDFLVNSCLLYLNKEKVYYIICDNGYLSKKASVYLDKKGFKTINVFDGLSSWRGPIS